MKRKTPKTCALCGAPGTQFKTLPPWHESKYSHTTVTCDAHAWYLDEQPSSTATCSRCDGPYGSCGCPFEAAARDYVAWYARAERGTISR